MFLMIIWLVVWNHGILWLSIYIYTYMGMSSSQLTIIFFRGVETTFFLNPTALMNSPFDFQAPGGKSICSEWQKELAGSADRPPAIPPATDEEVDNKQVPVDQSTVFRSSSVFHTLPWSRFCPSVDGLESFWSRVLPTSRGHILLLPLSGCQNLLNLKISINIWDINMWIHMLYIARVYVNWMSMVFVYAHIQSYICTYSLWIHRDTLW